MNVHLKGKAFVLLGIFFSFGYESISLESSNTLFSSFLFPGFHLLVNDILVREGLEPMVPTQLEVDEFLDAMEDF